MVDGEEGSSERCSKGVLGRGGSLRYLSKNILKQGVGKGKSCSQGEGEFEGVTTPPPPENFNRTLRFTSPLTRKYIREEHPLKGTTRVIQVAII